MILSIEKIVGGRLFFYRVDYETIERRVFESAQTR